MEVKGTAVMAIRDYVKMNHPDQYDKWLMALSGETKKVFIDYIDSSKWYPTENGAIEPTIQLCKLFYNGDIKKGAWESGRYSAQKGLSGIYKLYVKASSPIHIISRASRVFAAYYRPCEMSLADEGDKTVSVIISKMEKVPDVIKFRIAGWIEKALEISGAKNIQTSFSEKTIDNQTVFGIDLAWD